MISIAPATPPRTWFTSSANATARLRPSDRARSIAASLATITDAITVAHIARVIAVPTAIIPQVSALARRRGSLAKAVNKWVRSQINTAIEHYPVNNRLKSIRNSAQNEARVRKELRDLGKWDPR